MKPSSTFLKAIFWCRILFSILDLSFHCLTSFFLLFSLILYSIGIRGSFQGEVDERDGNRKGRLSASSRQNCALSTLSKAKYEIQYVREKWDFSLLSVTLSSFYKWSCYLKKNGKSLLHFGLCHCLRGLEKKDKYGSYRL